MTVTNIERDAERLTLTITAEFDAAINAVWQLWENPRHLEQWWGPPTYPATFVDHDGQHSDGDRDQPASDPKHDHMIFFTIT